MTKEPTNNSGLINNFFSKPVVGVVCSVITAVIGALAGAVYQTKATENAIVEKMAAELSMIDENKSLAQAIEDIKRDIEEKDKQISELEALKEQIGNNREDLESVNDELKENLVKFEEKLSEYMFITPKLYVDGIANLVDQETVMLYKGNVFYDQSILDKIITDYEIIYNNGRLDINKRDTGDKPDTDDKTDNDEDISFADIVYDGYDMEKYVLSDEKKILIGNNEFREGVILNWNGFALLELDRKYSKMTFDVGRITGSPNRDAVLKIYKDNVLISEETILASDPLRPIELDLKDVYSLKISVKTNWADSKYGFVNMKFYK